MKILVFSHRLEIGGSLVNAIELSGALRDLYGHDIVFFATEGPMLKLVSEKGLRYVPAPTARFHPSISRAWALHRLVQRERPDLIHAWEYYQCLDAYYTEHLLGRVPMIVTGMFMDVNRILPKSLPTTFGTPELVDKARAQGRGCVELLVPPVDTHANAPGAVDASEFRLAHGIGSRDICLVTVSRLFGDFKGESLLRTIMAVRELGHELPLRLLIVGDGDARARLEESAQQCNAYLGREAVTLVGAMLDPRPAYEAADIVIGMGGSALRGMAFGKPVIVVGANGFAATLTPQTAHAFHYKGIYGTGNGDDSPLVDGIRQLASRPKHRVALGRFARQFACEHFSLNGVASRFEQFCHLAVAKRVSLHQMAPDAVRTTAIWARERRWSE